METHHGEIGCRGEHWWHRTRVSLWHIHTDVGHGVAGEEVERLVAIRVGQPSLVTELDAGAIRLAPAHTLENVVLITSADRKPLRKLEQHRAKFTHSVQRLECGQESLPDGVDNLLVDILQIEV